MPPRLAQHKTRPQEWYAGRQIGWKIALAFGVVIALGLAGYLTAVRAMAHYARQTTRTQKIVSVSIAQAEEAYAASEDSSFYTMSFIYTSAQDQCEKKWEADEAADDAFHGLLGNVHRLPHSAGLLSLAQKAVRCDDEMCHPLENQTLRMTATGHQSVAKFLYESRYTAARYRLQITLQSLIAGLRDYQNASQASELASAHRAILVGWAFQGLILTLSALIALLIARYTSRTLSQLQSAQTQMQQSERLLVNAQRIARIGNWHLDLTARSVSWSDEMYHILGYEAGGVRASHKTYLARIHREDYGRTQEIIRQAQKSKQPFSFYHRLVWRDGTQHWVHTRGEFLCSEGGEIVAMTGTLQDVTERKQTDDALRESEARFQRIVANLPSMVYRFVLHPDGSVDFPFVSEGCRDIYEMEPDEFTRQPNIVMSLAHPDDQASFQDSVAESARLMAPWDWEGRICLPSGRERWVRGVSRPERGENDDILWDGILTDVTERRQFEETLSRSEERFRALIGNASDTILILDGAARLCYASPGLERQSGYEQAALRDAKLFDFVHPEDASLVRATFEQTRTNPDTDTTVEFRFRDAGGAYHPVEMITKNLFDEPAIRGIIATCRDITERKAFEEELAHQAFHDSLTGLPNRALFLDRLEQALVSTRRQASLLAVLFLDLDNFKVINDSLGHSEGDRFLMEVTRRLQTCLRPSDMVARLGGDEFVLLLEDLQTPEEAVRVTERIFGALRAPIRLTAREVFTTVSVGIALSGGDASEEPQRLLRDADTAMYQAKNNGKARCEVFTHSMNTRAMERLELEADLRRAIEDGELRLHYQPIVRLGTGLVGEVEALVRWQHPEHGLIPPIRFIPIAEETGLIVPLGGWVLREACRQARRWQEQHPCEPPLVVSVNLSGRQLQEPDCVEQIRRALHDTGVLPSTLKLEITETVMMRDAAATAETLTRLRGLGVRLAVDDFGTGYSSMAYLSRFPIDTLKIDRAFIQQMDEPEGYAIVQAIITLAKSLGLHVTSEGIETPEQWRQLAELGCEWGQGYYFARPQTEEAFTSLLSAGPAALGSDPAPRPRLAA